ncbi:alpha/beta hydrolase family protein [Candidatus Mancarchaeum acidiphilum]|nr:prolyl oligopeptidase family serine peptidase [Candidatus Mancarchaeum acidiphilum]
MATGDWLGTYLIRYKGVLATILYNKSNTNGKLVLLAYGMPGFPPKISDGYIIKLVKLGFSVGIPEYLGTFDSSGRFNFENAATSLAVVASGIKENKCTDLISSSPVSLDIEHVTLIGASFGGSVVLVAAAKSYSVDSVLAIAPVTDYSKKFMEYYGNESVDSTMDLLSKLQKFTWKFDKKDVKLLNEGKLDINPLRHMHELKSKRVALWHGKLDRSVNYLSSVDFFYSLKFFGCDAELNLFPRYRHMGLGMLNNRNLQAKLIKWL